MLKMAVVLQVHAEYHPPLGDRGLHHQKHQESDRPCPAGEGGILKYRL